MAVSSIWTAVATWLGVLILGATLYETARAAKGAAAAARETARAVDVQIRSDGPIVILKEVKVFPQTSDFIHPVFKNIGKSPAILIEASINYEFGIEDLPPQPIYGKATDLEREFLVDNDTRVHFKPVGRRDVEKICDPGIATTLWGYIRYEDVFGRRMRRGFGQRIIGHLDDPKDGITPIWGQAGGEAYNYDHIESEKLHHSVSTRGHW